MKSIASIHRKNKDEFEAYIMLDMRFYNINSVNLSEFQYTLSEFIVISFEYHNENTINITEITNLSEEKDLNFLMKFLNFSKGLLWTEIYKRTYHLMGKNAFIPQKGFFESAINLNNNELNYILNFIDLNFLVRNSFFVKNHMDIIVNRLFSETERIDIPESFSLELSDYILKNILQIENVDSLKLFEYKELVPSNYLFQRILNGKDMFETNKDTSDLVRFTIQHLHGNPSEFISVLNSEFLMEYIYQELNDYLKIIFLNHKGLQHLIESNSGLEYISILNEHPEYIAIIPDEYYEIKGIFKLVSNLKKLQYVIKTKESDDVIKSYFILLSNEERISVLPILPKIILLDFPKYIRYLPKDLMREVAFEHYELIWEYIPEYMKGKVILDIMKNEGDPNTLIKILYDKRENNNLFNILLYILTTDNKSSIKYKVLSPHKKINEGITLYLQNSEMKVEKLKNNMSLLPTCERGQTYYCEMRTVTPHDKDNYTFCPRMKHSCELGITNGNLNKDSDDWGFFEIFEKYGMKFALEELTNPNEYVNKLAGYVNRLIELEERMICRSCKERLIPNQKYSKFLARYSMTVAKCVNPNHEQVYFNHCWNCSNIIDSRECLNRKGKYYLCMSCGAGVDDKKSSDFVEPGTICPKCRHDQHKYTHDYLNKNSECLRCSHKILQKKTKWVSVPSI